MDPKTKSAKLESRIYMRQPVKGWCYRKAPDTIRNPELLFRLKKGASIRAKGMGYPDLDDLFLSGNLIQWIGEGDSRPRYPKRMATCWRRGDATENLRDWVAKALPLQYLKLLTWALIVGGRGLNPIFFFWRSGISNILSTRQKKKNTATGISPWPPHKNFNFRHANILVSLLSTWLVLACNLKFEDHDTMNCRGHRSSVASGTGHETFRCQAKNSYRWSRYSRYVEVAI